MADVPATASRRPGTRAGRILLRLDRAADRPWFLPALSVFPLSDYVLPVLPNQLLLVGVSALHPRRWRAVALTFVTASAAGAFLVASVVQSAGLRLLEQIGGETGGAGEFVAQHGVLALAVLALLPWTPRLAVVACALAGISPWAIALTVLAARPLPVALLAATGARAPRLLRRFRRIDRVLTEVRAAGSGIGTEPGPRPGTLG
ncbi:hypothetical protein ACFYXL_12215 [Streptomyces tsukubensis]|uniref:hypothetical protein n=1 Tax=Streptomyces tsukubensis TaxID=83656 RepID=UPI0036BEBD05